MPIPPYMSIADLAAQQVPGLISRAEPATGFNVPGIRINGEYVLVESFEVFQHQDIKMRWFAGQGGTRSGISDFGKKYIQGTFSCPILIDRTGNLLPGVRSLLDAAQLPTSPLRIDTSHALSHISLTAEDGGTDNNQLLSFDSCLVTDLAVTAEPGQSVKINATVTGSIDLNQISTLPTPPAEILVRALTWADCDASRYQSAMRAVSRLTVKIKNETENGVFLVPNDSASTLPGARHDQIDYLGVRQTEWSGEYEEMLRRGLGVQDNMHGGWMVGENLALSFGPVSAIFTVPVFNPAEQPLGPKWMRRTTKFFAQIDPTTTKGEGALFSFSEE